MLLCLVACAVAVDPATLLAIAAKSKAASEAAAGVGEIFKNLGDALKNDGEDIADEAAKQSQNIGKHVLSRHTLNSKFNAGGVGYLDHPS